MTKAFEILLNGTDYTDILGTTNATFETDFLYVERTGPRSVLASFPNGMGVVINATTSMLSFTMIVPEDFRGILRGRFYQCDFIKGSRGIAMYIAC